MSRNKNPVKGLACLLLSCTIAVASAEALDDETCETYVWPNVRIHWVLGDVDNYYIPKGLPGTLLGGPSVESSCSHDFPLCCDPLSAVEESALYIDGVHSSSFGGWLPAGAFIPPGLSEGPHLGEVRVTLKSAVTGEERTYDPSYKYFYVDDTAPAIAFTTPQDEVIVSTADMMVSGQVLDPDAKIGRVYVSFGVTHGECRLRKTPESDPAWSISWTYCNIPIEGLTCDSIIGTRDSFSFNRDINDYVIYTGTSDCGFIARIFAYDRVNNDSYKFISFGADKMPPEVLITTWPTYGVVSDPAIAGTAADPAEIQSVSLKIAQLDRRGTTTYWNGANWAADVGAMITLEIPPGTTSLAWAYGGLTDRNIISGSQYTLTVHAVDKFGHTGTVEQKFDYNVCVASPAFAAYDPPDKFETGSIVFRKLQNSPLPRSIEEWGHNGIYVVSDSDYQKTPSTATFVARLQSNGGKLVPVSNSDHLHYIVHADGEYVRGVSAAEFIKGDPNNYWGARTPKSGSLSANLNDRVAYQAALLLGKEYVSGILPVDLWQYDPGETLPKRFRCDGLVIHAYKQAGVPLVPSEEEDARFQTPIKLLHEKTVPLDVSWPELSALSVNDLGDRFRLSAVANDAESGIDRIEYYLYPSTAPDLSLLAVDDADTLGSQARTLECNCNPGKNLVARVFDRAGNWREFDAQRQILADSSQARAYSVPQPAPPPHPPAPIIKPRKDRELFLNIQSDAFGPADLVATYALDKPFSTWPHEENVVLAPGIGLAHFYASPGTHTAYVAVMDKWMTMTTGEVQFKIPGAQPLTGANISVPVGEIFLGFANITRAASFHANPTSVDLPEGYTQLPTPLAYDVHIDADYTGGFTIGIKYADAGVQPWQEPYLRLLHNGQDITQGVDRVNKVVFGYSTTASPFAVAIGGQATPDVEAPDLWPPFTTLEPIEDVYIDWQGGNFISTRTAIGLLAEDDRGGMVDTYYTPDLTEALFETGLVPGSLGQFTAYSPGFTLAEGVRRLGYGSADAAGNYELLKEATFYVDGTPPVTRLTVDGMEYPAGAEIYVVEGGSIALDAMDPVSNGVASGVEEIAWLADIDPESCPEDDGEGEPEDPPGTCGNSRYAGPFTLAEGSHTVHYFSPDHVGNAEMRSVRIYVDGTPPEVWLHAAGSTVPDGGEAYLIEGDSITLEALDPVSNGVASGLNETEYLIDVTFDSCPPEEEDGEGEGGEGEDGEDEEDDGPRGTCGNSGYEGPFTLTPGTHTVYYLAHDMVMNASAVRTAYFTVAPSSGAAEASITPSSGPIGLPFTITGEGFGTYSAGTTLALIGGATAPLTLWTDTQIKGTVPGSLAAGEYPIVVMRGSELLAETSSFTVVVPALAEIAPSSGPIGLPFTLTGGGFGNYVANYTRVLIGGTACPLTLWTDTQIKGTIPGAIAPGIHEVLVERALNGGLVQSAPVSFDIRNMEADWITPSSGPIGMPFTIAGSGFGNYVANYTTVLMGGTTCPLTLWTDGQIKGTVPGGLATGQYPVLVERRTADGGVMHSPEMSFTVLAVDAASMTPVAGPIGIPFTIYGAGFGNYSAGWTRVLIGGTTAPLTLWSDTQIKGTVPGAIEPGAHEVIVQRQLNGGLVASQPLVFTLTVPALAAVVPSSGPIGLPFTLTGSGFGNYVANNAKVLIGGTTAPLTLWTDGQIKGTVPGTIEPGTHEVLVERAFNGGVAHSQALSFELADPVLESVSPSPAAVLSPFTLTGYNFGNYAAGKSEALIGGATAQLTLWTDTQIKGKLPALGEGDYPVLVRRSFNGGVSQSEVSTMTLVEPSVSSMTPTAGTGGEVFSIYGAFFGPYDAAIARVLIGGLPSSLSLWNDGRINGSVPAELGVGTHTVIVSRGQYQADPLEFYVPEGGGYSPSSFMAPLAPSAAFRLGEVYVYPNPAKGGAAPVFHLEFGLADKLELKVYSVAGTLVHERTFTGPPQVTSPVYAYEYAWEGHIASGVYYFTVEAERAGSKLKSRGKFAVVR